MIKVIKSKIIKRLVRKLVAEEMERIRVNVLVDGMEVFDSSLYRLFVSQRFSGIDNLRMNFPNARLVELKINIGKEYE